MYIQGFIQALFLMSVFRQRLSLKGRWGSQGSIISILSSQQSPGSGSGTEVSVKMFSFYIWRAKKSLKIEETY